MKILYYHSRALCKMFQSKPICFAWRWIAALAFGALAFKGKWRNKITFLVAKYVIIWQLKRLCRGFAFNSVKYALTPQENWRCFTANHSWPSLSIGSIHHCKPHQQSRMKEKLDKLFIDMNSYLLCFSLHKYHWKYHNYIFK